MAKEYIEREATCKNCLHFAACRMILRSAFPTVTDEELDKVCSRNNGCSNFKHAADVVEVRHGEWVYDPDGMDWGLGAWLCSLCHVKNNNLGGSENINPYQFAGSKYCPHCGAKMDGVPDTNVGNKMDGKGECE